MRIRLVRHIAGGSLQLTFADDANTAMLHFPVVSSLEEVQKMSDAAGDAFSCPRLTKPPPFLGVIRALRIAYRRPRCAPRVTWCSPIVEVNCR